MWADLILRSRELLAEMDLEVPTPFDLDEFAGHLARARGRRIQLYSFRQSPGTSAVCGYTIQHRHLDVVCYQVGVSGRSSVHNAVHELAHLVLGHGLARPGLAVAAASLTSGMTTMSEQHELEAEAFAAVVLGRWDGPPLQSWSAWWALRQTANRITAALG